MIDFQDIEYLREGNERQRNAYLVLKEREIFEKLKKYNPILTGTIPIEIDLPDSDLDIICECADHEEFSKYLTFHFGAFEEFRIWKRNHNETESTIATFKAKGFLIEIFGQNIPTIHQYAFRHMLVEHQVLREKGLKFKEDIKKLKSQGLKTEPAFAHLLELKGDPYSELLKLENNILIREIENSEIDFLQEMLYQAIYVTEGTTLQREIIKQPELSKYIEGFGRDDDFCFVAEHKGMLIGAIWLRLFSNENKGYGFVDNKTPELSMAVLKQHRNKGVGKMLLESLIKKIYK